MRAGKMMRFYKMTLRQYRSLALEDSEGLWQAITVLEAREQLLKLRVADWPSLKKTDRSKHHRELHKDAFPPSLSGEGTTMSTADFAAFLAKGGKRA